MRHDATSGAPGPGPGIDAAMRLATVLEHSCSQVVLDQPDVVRLAVAALLTGGHVLLEGPPGVGKTLLAKALARSVGGTFARVQGTSDLLPSDITGVSVFDPARRHWEFRPGPIFADVVLFDELNRATPRAQSALLEAMAERQVTVDGERHPLADTHLVLATQNPSGEAGTFTVIEGARDRFLVTLRVDPPSRAAEIEVVLGSGGEHALAEAREVATTSDLRTARSLIERVHVVPDLAAYVVDVAAATRQHPLIAQGASPRASKAMLAVARSFAVACGRDYVAPDDVKRVAAPVLAHRLVLRTGGSTEAAARVVAEVLSTVAAPVV